MPSTTIAYFATVSETGAGTAWTNVNNMVGAPNASQATATLLLGESTKVALGTLSLQTLTGKSIVTVSVTVRASDSAYDPELGQATVFARLYDGTTAIGTENQTNCTASALTDYTFSLSPSGWGVALTPSIISRLRVGVRMGGNAASSNVGIDSVGVVVGWVAGGGGRSRPSRSRNR